MIIKVGEMFKEALENQSIIVTANSTLKFNSELVMGVGAALGLKKLVPGIEKVFGKMVRDTCGTHGEYGLLFYKRYGIFQTKTNYRYFSTLNLINLSTDKLKKVALENKQHIYNLNYPGIGHGKLEEKEVLPIIEKLPDNVYIWKRY